MNFVSPRVADIAQAFQSRIIGLFINRLGAGGVGRHQRGVCPPLMEEAHKLVTRLGPFCSSGWPQHPVELRRFEAFEDNMASITAREARAADASWRRVRTACPRNRNR